MIDNNEIMEEWFPLKVVKLLNVIIDNKKDLQLNDIIFLRTFNTQENLRNYIKHYFSSSKNANNFILFVDALSNMFIISNEQTYSLRYIERTNTLFRVKIRDETFFNKYKDAVLQSVFSFTFKNIDSIEERQNNVLIKEQMK